MVGDNGDRVRCPLDILSPLCEGKDDREEFTIIDIVTVYLLSHGIFLLSFLHRTQLLFGMCSYDWVHCLILLSSLNSSFIEL